MDAFTTVACGTVQPPINDTIKLVAVTNACKATLNWTTASEQNSVRFDIEESTDNINWQVVGTLAAAGNSTIVRQYSITITPKGPQVFYRIKLVKTNTHVKYSNTVQVNTLCPVITSDIDILTVVNNPGNISLQLYSSIGRGNALLIFVDAIGRQYLKKALVVNAGLNYYIFEKPQYLAKGAYFVKIVTADQRWQSNTIKLLLIK
jgi:hypothetical protein